MLKIEEKMKNIGLKIRKDAKGSGWREEKRF